MLKEDEDDDDYLFGQDIFPLQRQKSKTEYQKRESFHLAFMAVHGIIEENPLLESGSNSNQQSQSIFAGGFDHRASDVGESPLIK